MSEQCAYIHCRPDSSVFYVGKGTLARANNIEKGRRNIVHKRIVAKYGAENIKVGVLECSSESVAFSLEKGLIKCFKASGVVLVNMTDGGEGKLGCPNSAEAVARTAEKNRGKKRSKDFCLRASAWMTGRVVSDATKNKIRAAVKEKPLPEAFRRQWGMRVGALNGKARAVVGHHPEHGNKHFETLTAAAKYVCGDCAKVCRAIKLGHKHKGWTFRYAEKS